MTGNAESVSRPEPKMPFLKWWEWRRWPPFAAREAMSWASPEHQTSWRQTTSGGDGGEDGEEGGIEEVEVETADADVELDQSISARPMASTRRLLSLDAGNSRPQQLRVTTFRRRSCSCC